MLRFHSTSYGAFFIALERQRLNKRNSSLQVFFVTSVYVATMHLP